MEDENVHETLSCWLTKALVRRVGEVKMKTPRDPVPLHTRTFEVLFLKEKD